MDAHVFTDIAIILGVATAMAMLMRILKQPLIIGHIITGLLIGPSVFNLVKITETTEVFSSIGVTLLLFIIGLGLNPKVIKEVGKIALITGVGQILFTVFVGFGIANLLGFELVPAIYISLALAFSSTIIILKLLSDKKELNRLHGKIATGFLLVQDLVAVLLLILISTLAQDREVSLPTLLWTTLIKGIGFIGVLWLIAAFVLPKFATFFSKSQEFLFLFAIGWGFSVAAICAAIGFSIEIGALAAGVALAGQQYAFEISARLRPLRDFFIVIFFILLGAGMTVASLSDNLLPAILFSLFVLIGNPIIVMILMGSQRYTKKTSFKTSLAVAQISEFSLILILLGTRVGQVPEEVSAMLTLVALITIAVSTYMILYSDSLYEKFSKILSVFERKDIKKETKNQEHYDIILFGYRGASHNLVKTFQKLQKKYLVIDFNPETIEKLDEASIPNRYGDANDTEFLSELPFEEAKLVIVNITDYNANALVVEHVRIHNKNAGIITMMATDDIEKALELYEWGANYVTMPQYHMTEKLSNIITRHGLTAKSLASVKEHQTKYLLKETLSSS